MGAKCQACKQDMLKAKGCSYTHIQHKGKLIQRSLEHWCEPGQRCPDCGALYGQPHHAGCDIERCPLCGDQMIGCSCYEGDLYLAKIVPKKEKKSA